MKIFLAQLKNQWAGVFSYKPYYRWQIKNIIRETVVLVNSEAADFINQCKQNFKVLFVSLLLTCIMLAAFFVLDSRMIAEALNDVTLGLLGIITLFFTVAIFMATLSNQAITKMGDEMADFLKVLHAQEPLFDQFYSVAKDMMNDNQKYTVLRGFGAESVFEQSHYVKYRQLINSAKQDITDASFDISFSFDSVKSLTTYRAWPIKEAVRMYMELEERLDKSFSSQANRKRITQLYSAANDFEINGNQNVYSQQQFLGNRLTRVIVYGLIAVFVYYVFSLFNSYPHDIFSSINLHTATVLLFLSLITSAIASALSVKYILGLLQYLRYSSVYYVNGGSNIYPLEGEASVQNYYGGGM